MNCFISTPRGPSRSFRTPRGPECSSCLVWVGINLSLAVTFYFNSSLKILTQMCFIYLFFIIKSEPQTLRALPPLISHVPRAQETSGRRAGRARPPSRRPLAQQTARSSHCMGDGPSGACHAPNGRASGAWPCIGRMAAKGSALAQRPPPPPPALRPGVETLRGRGGARR